MPKEERRALIVDLDKDVDESMVDEREDATSPVGKGTIVDETHKMAGKMKSALKIFDDEIEDVDEIVESSSTGLSGKQGVDAKKGEMNHWILKKQTEAAHICLKRNNVDLRPYGLISSMTTTFTHLFSLQHGVLERRRAHQTISLEKAIGAR